MNQGNALERYEEGRAAYQQACAGCHESGQDGAPVPERAADWEDRSSLWEAVLFEHAQQGYLKMPARGGDSSVSDYDAEAAAEYMLGLVYPDRLRD
ncbi:c-type cytochrome [Candidatus Litorirhabdus singularis]|uniref:c-type cytochrome n=1 Tax=Candidatus Litorirhabdus singularis TaxID=2518993 RepID=UPI0024320E40|nr:c-type cytochrome [Candidatus Litorirhabdus singularis]